MQAVTDLARTVLADDAVKVWMRAPNRLLGHRKPLDLVASGQHQRVKDLLLALAEGVTV
ncbi:antitoxin Xre/MbcA/ParS toxin-binding domain-containing protein [Candidatus Poriferisocius sp.]|uniref:antitoxin Xre/MbcA/ParS toxin-binding domain-containing protein n=1 Tax=Candidatus Poriferisocius sp. TaxID=3101276 RepID=UPI003B5B2535